MDYSTTSTSTYSAKINERIVIDETGTTRKVLDVVINDKKMEAGETVSITIVHQRKKGSDWEDVKNIQLSTLKGGEGIKLNLDSSTTKKLYDRLSELYALVAEKGVQFGTKEFTVARANEVIKVDSHRRVLIERLIRENYSEEIWNELLSNDPDLATKLSWAKVQYDRTKALEEFRINLEDNKTNEGYWQNFFFNNQWIFGYGLNYQFLNIITDQPDYGGTNFTGKGAQRGDYLTNTSATAKFTVLVEIKTLGTNLLSIKKGQNVEVRNDVWLLSGELLGSVSQIQVNSKTWNRTSQEKKNFQQLESESVFTVEPKGILVIGSTSEFQNHESKLCSFELFRRNLKNPEVITFDELYERAKFIVSHNPIPKT